MFTAEGSARIIGRQDSRIKTSNVLRYGNSWPGAQMGGLDVAKP